MWRCITTVGVEREALSTCIVWGKTNKTNSRSYIRLDLVVVSGGRELLTVVPILNSFWSVRDGSVELYTLE